MLADHSERAKRLLAKEADHLDRVVTVHPARPEAYGHGHALPLRRAREAKEA
jgi:hypothetical protein